MLKINILQTLLRIKSLIVNNKAIILILHVKTRWFFRIIYFLTPLFFVSCESILLNNEKAFARVGSIYLYREDIEKNILNFKNKEDSILKVRNFIDDWASKQIILQQAALNLDEDKIKSLESVDTLDKLKREFLNFKDIVARQMGTIGGGGLNPDKVDADLIPVKTATFNLGSADKTFKDLYLSGSSLVIGGTTMVASELTVLDSVTVGTISASKAVIVDSSKDITGFRNITMTGDLTISGTNILTQVESKATKAFAIAQAVALG